MIDRFTEKAREAIQAAAELAAQLDHGYVGTEHLLLGLIREGTGVAAMILGHYGVTEEKVWFSLVVVSVSGPMGADPHFYPSASEIRIQYRHMGCGGLKPAYFGAVPSFFWRRLLDLGRSIP